MVMCRPSSLGPVIWETAGSEGSMELGSEGTGWWWTPLFWGVQVLKGTVKINIYWESLFTHVNVVQNWFKWPKMSNVTKPWVKAAQHFGLNGHRFKYTKCLSLSIFEKKHGLKQKRKKFIWMRMVWVFIIWPNLFVLENTNVASTLSGLVDFHNWHTYVSVWAQKVFFYSIVTGATQYKMI